MGFSQPSVRSRDVVLAGQLAFARHPRRIVLSGPVRRQQRKNRQASNRYKVARNLQNQTAVPLRGGKAKHNEQIVLGKFSESCGGHGEECLCVCAGEGQVVLKQVLNALSKCVTIHPESHDPSGGVSPCNSRAKQLVISISRSLEANSRACIYGGGASDCHQASKHNQSTTLG